MIGHLAFAWQAIALLTYVIARDGVGTLTSKSNESPRIGLALLYSAFLVLWKAGKCLRSGRPDPLNAAVFAVSSDGDRHE